MATKRRWPRHSDHRIKKFWARNVQGPVTMITIFFRLSYFYLFYAEVFVPLDQYEQRRAGLLVQNISHKRYEQFEKREDAKIFSSLDILLNRSLHAPGIFFKDSLIFFLFSLRGLYLYKDFGSKKLKLFSLKISLSELASVQERA